MAKKATYKEAVKATGWKPKRLKQTILSFAPKKISDIEVREKINNGICPSIASGAESLDPESIISVRKVDVKKSSGEVSCNGLLAKKDLTNIRIQQGITYLCQYTIVGDEKQAGFKFGFVQGMNNIQLLFCNQCTGDLNSVR